MTFAQLDDICRQAQAIDHALSILFVDGATIMPAGASEQRAQAVEHLEKLRHTVLYTPRTADLLSETLAQSLPPQQQAAVAMFERRFRRENLLSRALASRIAGKKSASEYSWRAARRTGDWQSQKSIFKELVTLVREEANERGQNTALSPYDVMVDKFEPEIDHQALPDFFRSLKTFLTTFVPKVAEGSTGGKATRDRRKLTLEPGTRENLSILIGRAMGFDFSRGRLCISEHPFCGGHPNDVRIALRAEDSLREHTAILLHELGHALYEQNLPQEWHHWQIGKAGGMAIHESQSKLFEDQVGQSLGFRTWLFEQMRASPATAFFVDETWLRPDAVIPQPKRVGSDPVTYPLHIIVRYEIERDLINGDLSCDEILDAWNWKMRSYLGLGPMTWQDGPMQDIHWAAGAFGYFPCYSLGASMAAQQWDAITSIHGSLSASFSQGDFEDLLNWCRKNIWRHGSMYPADALMAMSTGKGIGVETYISNLQSRYCGL